MQCSKKTGRLVERVCPAADNAKAREEAAHQAKRDANRAATQAQRVVEREQRIAAHAQASAAKRALRELPITELAKLQGRDTYAEVAARYAKLKAWELDLSACPFRLRLSRSETMSAGRAWGGAGRGSFTVTAGSDIADVHATILHELAHLAAPAGSYHRVEWRLFFRAAVAEVIGRVPNLGPQTQSGDLSKEGFHNALKRELALFLYGGAT